MTTLREHLNEQLKDPEFTKAWEEGEAEFQVRRAMIAARDDAGMTQAELAKATGLKQAAISRIETGDTNPTLATLAKVARGMGKELRVQFV